MVALAFQLDLDHPLERSAGLSSTPWESALVKRLLPRCRGGDSSVGRSAAASLKELSHWEEEPVLQCIVDFLNRFPFPRSSSLLRVSGSPLVHRPLPSPNSSSRRFGSVNLCPRIRCHSGWPSFARYRCFDLVEVTLEGAPSSTALREEVEYPIAAS